MRKRLKGGMRKRPKEWYLIYAIQRFGFREGLRRYWAYHLSPVNWYEWLKTRYTEWRLRDRRKKLGWSRTVYVVNRDGDFGLIECPQCNQFQTLYFQRETRDFDCCTCGLRFDVYLEDGLVKMQDHREGNLPTPGTCVEDNTGRWHIGIAEDAPWWWKRKSIHRDFNPNTGRDGHDHYPYAILPPRPQQPGPGDCEACEADGVSGQ